MKKLILMSVITAAALCGCDSRPRPCKVSADKEYGESNVFELRDYKYIVKDRDRIYYVEKMSGFNSVTTTKTDITRFINED